MSELITEATKSRLISYIERVERLEDNKMEIAEDIKEVFSEAKSEGFDPKIMKKIVAERRKDVEDRLMEEELMTIYKEALGMNFTEKGEK